MAKESSEPEVDLEGAREVLADLLHGKFQPAASLVDAESYYTTEHIFSMLDRHSPEQLPKRLFRDAMLLLGFKEHVLDDEIVWLVKAAG